MIDNNYQGNNEGEILVVEDLKVNLLYLTEILSKKGYKVRPAVDGELALQSIQSRLPDIILMDIMLPRIDGIEVCKP